MICPTCHSSDGTYTEVETFHCTDYGDWVYSTYYQCFACGNVVHDWEDNFEYEDE